LELTGEAKLGKGEKLVRNAEKNKAAKRVREGLSHKQNVRGKKELEQVSVTFEFRTTDVNERSGEKFGQLSSDLEKSLRSDIIAASHPET